MLGSTVLSEESAAPPGTIVILGGGPAGLTAALETLRLGWRPVVVEKDPLVGGIARTVSYKGFHFDMGGHRFFTKSEEVNRIWQEVLGTEFLKRPRLSRIFYRQRFFQYPLQAWDALRGLGLGEAILVLISYVRWQVRPHPREDTFEEWVTNRFGRRLFETFFKTYTEKVWGIPCTELKAEWAAQRIKDLSLRTVIIRLFFKSRKVIKTLIEEFDYPRLGPGMMWRAVADKVRTSGGEVRLECEVVSLERVGSRITAAVVRRNGVLETVRGEEFISSLPLRDLVQRLDPPAPDAVLEAAQGLRYRDFLTVCLIVDQPHLFPDNWIYIHEPAVRVARIQNFKNWSPDMVPDPAKSSLGLEYFCNEGDELWQTPDADLVDLARREIDRIGLARAADVTDGCVFRVPKSYPVYDSDYAGYVETLKAYVETLENCRTIGRNGLHRYNNQDHSMLTGLYAVRNALRGEANDLWSVNADAEYHEEGTSSPASVDTLGRQALRMLLAQIDPVALGAAGALVVGGGLAAATLALVLKGGTVVGPTLGLLSIYFPGYHVSASGVLVGAAYGAAVGYVAGWLFATLRNATVLGYVRWLRARAQRAHLGRMLDDV